MASPPAAMNRLPLVGEPASVAATVLEVGLSCWRMRCSATFGAASAVDNCFWAFVEVDVAGLVESKTKLPVNSGKKKSGLSVEKPFLFAYEGA
ncbi:hypothetical protein RHSIM_Rhsim02G0256500 [Rhododendron simsii]|uniref:Uncharacterized protein n=1 Tax=Rhododendron simsii TaxID=118357 RepID=A0A834HG21_RHOSS|nr:hypothetical protein RHSIM_Rhsim02G0256500 [Rhododendron simsii]